MKKYQTILDYEIDEEPCKIGVTRFFYKPPTYSWHADSDLDFYGFKEIQYDVLTVDEKPWPELEKRMTKKTQEHLEDFIFGELFEEA